MLKKALREYLKLLFNIYFTIFLPFEATKYEYAKTSHFVYPLDTYLTLRKALLEASPITS